LLITGPAHVGKSTLGQYFAQQLNCQGHPKPCGQCTSCKKIASGNHPDVRIIDTADDAIKIDQIRELQRELSLSPHESEYRVTLLCHFEKTTTNAANALLKTLEEPAPQVVLILTAPEASQLLPTIVSRCQVVALRPLAHRDVLAALQTHWHVAPAQAELLAQLSGGRLGWAVRALADDTFLEQRRQRFEELQKLLTMSRADRLGHAGQTERDPTIIRDTLALWLTVWRDLLLLQSGSQARLVNLDWQDTLRGLAARINPDQARETIGHLTRALKNLERNVNPRLNLDVLLLKLPKLTEG
jgi:DNA polymerase-3 subunit delta'